MSDVVDAAAPTEAQAGPRPWLVPLAWLVLLGVLGACYGPFLGRAFHIDEPAYLHLSTLYGWNPLDARPSDYPYLGIPLEGMYPYESTHPFLVPYALKTARAWFGASEWAAHGFFLLFAAIALASLGGLAGQLRRVARNAAKEPTASGATLSGAASAALLVGLFATTPVFLLSSQSVMTDVPSLAFTLAAAALYVHAIERRGLGRWLVAGAALLAALCCSYQSVLIAPLLLLYAWRRGRLDRALFFGLALPGALFATWLALIWSRYEIFLFKSARPDSGFSAKEEIARAMGDGTERWLVLTHKAVHLLAIWGAATCFLLPLRARVRGRVLRFLVQTGLLAFAVALGFGTLPVPERAHGPYLAPDRALLGLLVALGLVAFGEAVAELRARRFDAGASLLFGMVVTFGLFAWLLLPFSAARYQLPVVAALWLLLGRPLLEVSSWVRHRWAFGLGLAGSLALGLACATADARHAGAYRELARDLAQEVAGSAELGRVHFIGEWGLRHYMLAEGGNYLLRESLDPQTGDLIVLAEMHNRFGYPSGAYNARVELYAERRPSDGWPLRVFHPTRPAGFYSSGYGLLPFVFAGPGTPYEVFQIWKVGPPGEPAAGAQQDPDADPDRDQ